MKGKFCPDTVLVPCLQYMSNAIELSSTYKIIKPHIFDILTKVYDWFCNAKLIIFMCVTFVVMPFFFLRWFFRSYAQQMRTLNYFKMSPGGF